MSRACQRQTVVLVVSIGRRHDGGRLKAADAHQYDPGTPDVLLWRVPIGDRCFELSPIHLVPSVMEIPVRVRESCTERPRTESQLDASVSVSLFSERGPTPSPRNRIGPTGKSEMRHLTQRFDGCSASESMFSVV